jgi:dolichol-phosphate mannosyltransferase
MATDLSIVVPCYNEAATIETTIASIDRFVGKELPEVSYELLIVNDGSTDNTLNLASQLKNQYSALRVYGLPYNQGRGAAMKEGIRQAQGHYMMFMDADLSYDVGHIKEVYDSFKENPNLDVVVVSPYTKGGEYKNIPFSRLMISRLANFILSGFFDGKISTVTAMCRGYKTEIIKFTPLLEDGKELHLEILRKMAIKGATIKEIPGRLIWKNKKERVKRKTNLKFVKAAQKHFLYGLLAKPARMVKGIAIVLLLVGIFEFINCFRLLLDLYPKVSTGSFSRDLWQGLAATFAASPHTVVIAITCTVFAIQALTFYILFTILQMQHRENIAHFLKLYEEMKK